MAAGEGTGRAGQPPLIGNRLPLIIAYIILFVSMLVMVLILLMLMCVCVPATVVDASYVACMLLL
jgi:hypothetical protein